MTTFFVFTATRHNQNLQHDSTLSPSHGQKNSNILYNKLFEKQTTQKFEIF